MERDILLKLVQAVKRVRTSIGAMNQIYSSDNTEGVATTTSVFSTISTLTLPAGTYVVTGSTWTESNTEGVRLLLLDTTETDTNSYVNSVIGTGRADLNKTRILNLEASTTIYLRAYQNSGSSLRTKGGIVAVKLK